MFDLRAQLVRVPELKVETICDQIDDLLANKSRTKREVTSVCGVLTWASQVVPRSRAFLGSLDIVLVRPCGWDDPVQLSKRCIEDLE